MKEIFIARHGEYANPKNIIPFRSNEVVLSQDGENKIKENAQLLKKEGLKGIFSSPVLRCTQTAQIYSDILELKYVLDDRLIETDSPYQGMDFLKFREKKQGRSLYSDPFHLNNGGETNKEVIDRMQKIAYDKLSKDKPVLLVSHGDPIMLFLATEAGLSLDYKVRLEEQIEYIPMGGILKFNYDDEGNFVEYKKLNY